jgi:hypothetical protein
MCYDFGMTTTRKFDASTGQCARRGLDQRLHLANIRLDGPVAHAACGKRVLTEMIHVASLGEIECPTCRKLRNR